MANQFDEALVERLATELLSSSYSHRLPDSELEARKLSHPWEFQVYVADVETVLTALSETHVIVPRPLMRRIDDSLCAMCMSRNGCDGCEILQIQRDLADCLAEEVSPRA